MDQSCLDYSKKCIVFPIPSASTYKSALTSQDGQLTVCKKMWFEGVERTIMEEVGVDNILSKELFMAASLECQGYQDLVI